jgi:hypothetical protein
MVQEQPAAERWNPTALGVHDSPGGLIEHRVGDKNASLFLNLSVSMP